jgi:hypothetical protein
MALKGLLSTSSQRKGRYRLLILNGHSSYLTPHFDQIYVENDIILICMPEHLSHFYSLSI